MHSQLLRGAALALALLPCGGCKAMGAGSFLVFGGDSSPQAKLVARVSGVQDEAVEAQEDFAAAFHLYQRLTAPQAVGLSGLSDDFEDELERCQARARDLAARIDSIHAEADALFRDWNDELARFSNEALRRKSAAMLLDTQARTQRVLAALERVRGRMEAVVLKLQDYALFFHHNLNARAIATLQDTYKEFDSEYKALETELGRAQGEVAAFLAHFEDPVPATAAQE